MPSDLIKRLQRHVEQVDSSAPSLEEMLASYGDYATEGDESDDELKVFDLGELEERTAPRRPKRRTGVLAAVAAAILIVVGVAVIVADRSSDGVVTDSESSPSVADPVSPPAEADAVLPGVVDALGYRWSRVPHDETVFASATIESVTAGGPGLVAVGTDDSGDEGKAVVWTSVDGVGWSRVPYNEEVFAGASLAAVTAGGPGLVAVGGDGPHEDGSAAVWTSVDGITWSRIAHDEVVFGGEGEQWMTSVTVGGPGLVAAGWELVGGGADAVVWTSPDGVTWSRVADEDEVFGGPSHQAIWGLTPGGPGLVAVGGDRSRNFEDGDVAVWTSIDGLTWSRVAHDEAVFGATEVTSVTVGGPGLVAVGTAVLTSADGLTWSRVPDNDVDFGGGEMAGVTTSGPGLVAVGGAAHPEVEGADVAAVWTSVDGITWTRVAHDEDVFGGAQPTRVIVAGQGLVAVGGADENAAVWVATPKG